jgi:hypothetical protein
MESLTHCQGINVKKSTLADPLQQQLPSGPASTKHENVYRAGFDLRGDVNSTICERRASTRT